MNPETVREYCLTKPGADESMPFGEHALVFKVGGKMFAMLSLDKQPATMNLKCDPERAEQLREEHPAVDPGYHMNKRHWNTITLGNGVRVSELHDWIDHSYELVFQRLPKVVLTELK